MSSFPRRRLVQAGSAATLTALAAAPFVAHAQAPVALRFSSSMTVDDNAAHYVWYQRLDAIGAFRVHAETLHHCTKMPRRARLGRETVVIELSAPIQF